MRRALVVLLGAVLLWTPAVAPDSPEDASPRPRIEVPQSVFKFGTVYEGEEITHTFKFKNVGNATLKVTNVRVPCGCGALKISSKKIPPGGTGELTFTFETRGYQGSQNKSIYIYTNDPREHRTRLQLRGEVKVEVEVKPRSLSFGKVPKQESATREIRIMQRGEKELVLGEITTDIGYLDIDCIEKREEGKKAYLLRVTLKDDAPTGRIKGVIQAATNLKRHKIIRVPVSGRVLGDIQLSLERILFTSHQGTGERIPLIISTRGPRFKILRIENEVEHLSTKLIPQEEGKKYRIDFTVNKDAPPGEIRGKVKVYTDYPGEREFVIPVVGWVRKQQAGIVPGAVGERIDIAYFFETGCLGCDRVENTLASLQKKFPAVMVKKYDMDYRDNLEFNEVLCEIGDVPEKKRMVTPALFIGKDFLSRKDITEDRLEELIYKYKNGATLPLGAARQMRGAAEAGIIRRFRSFGIPVVMGAGILDGVNPCAFATMVFLISYLAIVGRKGRQLVLIGAAFTSSVFITYLLLGIGILESLNRLWFLPRLARWIYGIMGGFTLILGILSVADYCRCRSGHPGEMRLQLPAFLKRRVRHAIRKRVGLGRYVLGAFGLGFIVSVLELTCTGQVYLPTIIYAMGVSELKANAYAYLVLYNLMFIVPLVAVFLLAYGGTTALGLSDILTKNMARIKLLTSMLFFLFAIFLITMLFI